MEEHEQGGASEGGAIAAPTAAYQDARLQFVSCNRLPHDFAFNVYLRKCIRQVFVELLHIHWGIWLAVCMLVQLDLFIYTSFINPQRILLKCP